MLLPKYLLKASGPSSKQGFSESISYDYSGQDEINKRKDEAGQQSAARYKALYDGDVGGSVAAGQRIRGLLSSLKDITPVRVASYSSNTDTSGDSGGFEGAHDQPQPMTQIENKYATTGVRGVKPPDRRPGATRRRVNNNIMAGDPQDFSHMS